MKRVGIYPGSFDPVTNGHLDIIKRASRLFDKLLISVADNIHKQPLFSVKQRVSFLKRCCVDMPSVEINTFKGLLCDAVNNASAVAVVRGLRAVSDFEWEFQMAMMNRELDKNCETIFMMPSPKYSFVSSNMIKEIAKLGGSPNAFVPAFIADELKSKFITKEL